MSNGMDKLLAELGKEMADQLAREATDPRWQRVAAGEMTAKEIHAAPHQGRPDTRCDEVFRPVDATFKEALAESLLANMTPNVVPIPLPKKRRKRSPVLFGLSAGGILAIAAGVLLVLRPTAPLSLPVYTSTFQGGDQLLRGDEPIPEVPTLHPDSLVSWLVRPEKRVEPPPHAVLFWQKDEQQRRLAYRPRVSTHGAVLVEATVVELGLTPGHGELVLVLVASDARGPAMAPEDFAAPSLDDATSSAPSAERAPIAAPHPTPSDVGPQKAWRRFGQPLHILPKHTP